MPHLPAHPVPRLISVNVGLPQDKEWAGIGRTSIDKRSVAGAVPVRHLGLEGDQVSDTRHHGGVDQAVYAFAREDVFTARIGLMQSVYPDTADRVAFHDDLLGRLRALPGARSAALTTGLDQVLAPVFSTLDGLEAYVDPGTAPSDFLDWLASWVGIELDQHARPFCEALQARGVLCKETHDYVIRFAPPLVVTREDLDFAVEIIAVPTVRDEDGLALSSRNAYLSSDDRARAARLPAALDRAAQDIVDGKPVSEALDDARKALAEAGFAIDYVALVDEATLEPVGRAGGRMRLIAAASVGGTRLIDNVPVEITK